MKSPVIVSLLSTHSRLSGTALQCMHMFTRLAHLSTAASSTSWRVTIRGQKEDQGNIRVCLETLNIVPTLLANSIDLWSSGLSPASAKPSRHRLRIAKTGVLRPASGISVCVLQEREMSWGAGDHQCGWPLCVCSAEQMESDAVIGWLTTRSTPRTPVHLIHIATDHDAKFIAQREPRQTAVHRGQDSSVKRLAQNLMVGWSWTAAERLPRHSVRRPPACGFCQT
ncbi:hypothetical protein JOF56_003033 [Kibdelosporangium banguiense]|uniref:Secreted protein n=1 Tax=Kibdelosporangium banguiense TaxID=1365924 RepID=A0ABS4TE05_9PSEU|nr:hypothetical protein [Kibdelosporangium banguiense]